MEEESSPHKEHASGNKKNWLRILIIVAIGIPVLLELSTLVNLVKVHFWGKPEPNAAETRVMEADTLREVATGDTLYVDSTFVLTLREMRVYVSPNRWEFVLTLGSTGDQKPGTRVSIDSLLLNSGRGLPASKPGKWSRGEQPDSYKMTEAWEIPNGDLPRELTYGIRKSAGPDSEILNKETVHIGPVPVRYHNDSDS